MPLKKISTGESLPSIISRVVNDDYVLIDKSGEFSFDWTAESGNEVFKIYLKDKQENILGLLSLMDYPEEYRIHLNLIEVGKSNVGKKKTIDNIAGCLIAVACKIAFDRDYFGFVSLKPKTKLISLYQEVYGFRQYGRLLGIEGEGSNQLIKKYLQDEEE
ncbi:hypothetical protein [Neolewinella agarilytica]|uniref:N-acetyltransferase domain-containing protein n=1 Tax=Neolewinella agarilytica TaxID=478744 RepID=A0A1H9HBH7_9BACT|nr:hypothetical protein [Neolewinella agarilytica]SEQ59607.1 hypothetical protein SAMN05444359_11290 [Neolewinella agarilytica]